MANVRNETVLETIRYLGLIEHIPRFIVVGGGAMRLMGNERHTADIDILVEASKRDTLLAYLRRGGYLVRVNNRTAIQFDRAIEPVPLDVLIELAGGICYDDVKHFTSSYSSTTVLRPDIALGIKLRTWYLRAESESGDIKRNSYLKDIVFLLDFMLERGLKVQDDCAQIIQINYLNIYLLHDRMKPADFDKMKSCDVQKLLKPWANHTLEQKELYEAMAETDLDPFTTS